MTAAADTGRYTIAVAAELTGMHPQTLRKYERAGLLLPTRQAGNQRLYSRVDIERLLRIQHLVHETGINIAGLVLVLAMTDRLDALDADATRGDLRTAIAEASGPSRGPTEA